MGIERNWNEKLGSNIIRESWKWIGLRSSYPIITIYHLEGSEELVGRRLDRNDPFCAVVKLLGFGSKGRGFKFLTLATLDEQKNANLLMCCGAIYPHKEQSKVIIACLTQQAKSSDSLDAETKSRQTRLEQQKQSSQTHMKQQ
ncbi:hypothetical protein TNCV_220991 [Trichonephila clavipes]|nr:hypothetical protein TNCV_220991 [Trichonephila clavipes]